MYRKILCAFTLGLLLFGLVQGGTPVVNPSEKPTTIPTNLNAMFWRAMANEYYALRSQGIGQLFFTNDTVVVFLEGATSDTAVFNISGSVGFFTLWDIPDTLSGHTFAADTITIQYAPGLDSTIASSILILSDIDTTTMATDIAYHTVLEPPPCEFLFVVITQCSTDTAQHTLILVRQ